MNRRRRKFLSLLAGAALVPVVPAIAAPALVNDGITDNAVWADLEAIERMFDDLPPLFRPWEIEGAIVMDSVFHVNKPVRPANNVTIERCVFLFPKDYCDWSYVVTGSRNVTMRYCTFKGSTRNRGFMQVTA